MAAFRGSLVLLLHWNEKLTRGFPVCPAALHLLRRQGPLPGSHQALQWVDQTVFSGGGISVPKQPDKADDLSRAGTIQQLVKETGITEAEASALLTVLGTDWSSLVREARILKAKR